MKLRPLGSTDLHVSELCLGALQFGWKTDERTSCAILDRFRDAGGNFVQATSLLGTPPPTAWIAAAPGEQAVGHWLRRHRNARGEIILATRLLARESRPSRDGFAQDLITSVEASLKRLGTDHLDLLLCEWSGSGVPPDEFAAAVQSLKHSGLVRFAGVSGWPAWRTLECHEHFARQPGLRLSAVQADFSLLDREPFTSDLAPLCREQHFGFLARSPLGGGALVDGARPSMPGFAERISITRDEPALRPVRETLHAVAHRRGASQSQTALAWVLAHPAVTSAVVGVTTADQLTGLIAATRRPLVADEIRLLDRTAAVAPAPLRPIPSTVSTHPSLSIS